nr:MAG TPA: tail assembly protein [Caudoviricetes sp.]
MEITVKLYGNLRKFGNEFKLIDVTNSAEALNALYCQINGLRKAIQQHNFFKVKLGKRYFTTPTLKEDVLAELVDGDILHVIPVIGGSGGAVQFVAGAVLAVVGFGTSWLGGAGVPVGMLGVALMAGGVAQMLTKVPPVDLPKRDETEKKQSTAFSNLQNLVAQGRPVPLAYGRILVGSLIIGKGVETVSVELYRPNEEVTNKVGRFGLKRRR